MHLTLKAFICECLINLPLTCTPTLFQVCYAHHRSNSAHWVSHPHPLIRRRVLTSSCDFWQMAAWNILSLGMSGPCGAILCQWYMRGNLFLDMSGPCGAIVCHYYSGHVWTTRSHSLPVLLGISGPGGAILCQCYSRHVWIIRNHSLPVLPASKATFSSVCQGHVEL